MLKKYTLLSALLLLAFTGSGWAQKMLALTIDDLPFVGESQNFHLNMIIEALKSAEVPATGFVIAKEVTPRNLTMLQKFRDAGLGLGNHTYSHANLNKLNPNAYIQDIATADKQLSPVLTEPKFFRYPYLVVGNGRKKELVTQFLHSRNYQVAPISIDSKDFIFNQLLLSVPQNERRGFLNVLKSCYLEFIWQQTLKAEEHNRAIHKPEKAQILLIHSNLLNAYVLPDIINLYKQHGYTFVNLEMALNKAVTPEAKPTPQLAQLSPEKSNIDAFVAWD